MLKSLLFLAAISLLVIASGEDEYTLVDAVSIDRE